MHISSSRLPVTEAPAIPSVPETVRAKGGGGGFRPEIEGLRAVAVLLVAVYHIWFGRVSGGVDVFLMLTGFLITGSLVRGVEREGRVRFAAFWIRLARRLVPPVAVVLVATMAATYLWLPRPRWPDILDEVRAAALYHENWILAGNAVDYLAREAAASPVQHFWSLSVQGQFYLLWPVLVALAAFVAVRARMPLRMAVLVAVTAVFALSLGYSVSVTARDQAWAYFDTGARLWELALGAILALVIHRVHLPVRLRVLLGWLGLTALVSCGLLVPVSTLFPGYAALWPTLAATLVVLAGTTGSRHGADRLLTWKPLTALGKLSYPLYLWHWPVLVCYLEAADRSLATPLGGLGVLALSLSLAWLTHRLVEGGLDRSTRQNRRAPGWSSGIAAALITPVLAASLLWSDRIEEQRAGRAAAVVPENYPGAGAVAEPALLEVLPEAPVRPDPADAKQDLSWHHEQGCHVGLVSKELGVCDTGPVGAEHTLALVGASRVAHWYPAVAAAAQARGWRLVSFTKSGCQFSTDTAHRDDAVFEECQRWKENAFAELAELRPDAVLTSSTRATLHGETVHDGYLEVWQWLDELGIEVIGLRDLPRLPYQGAECVEAGPPEQCTSPVTASQAETDPATRIQLPPNVTLLDLTEHVCPGGSCDAVVGNVLVYWDHSHITATYAATLAPVMEEALIGATGW
ncbi:acyltransferase [Nocardiopsis terrae]|uniref:Peptidoglycan/LPS O-acetylase OafA/YrhL n=1 Tax=Nocardiopsis terrae TaxID=372655 RepID=A0ABR9HK94_9ACTN|nr:acyltransferase family protein [Nocardiopsis terrae]MBE1459440.1 peptidoglycan/LPS O-acetylase OafA/YrhL [Nocardiopsis terrae]GHC97286.1 acyltransferase [Nocardiopsis terrae]